MKRSRWAASNRNPVPITSPEAAAEMLLRRPCSMPRSVLRRHQAPSEMISVIDSRFEIARLYRLLALMTPGQGRRVVRRVPFSR